jgi:NAD+ kinase
MSRALHRVAVLGHTGRSGVRRAAARLARSLAGRDREIRLVQGMTDSKRPTGHPLAELAGWCDVLIALGGDGTALRGARALAGKRGALLPINFGGLGFLTVAEESELEHAAGAALGGRWAVAKRRLLDVVVKRRGRRMHSGLAMNDAVLKTAGGYSALHLQIQALGHDLGHLVADGLIAATASGSTAYSMSAGGPVVSPDVDAVVVTPVCPHTIASRTLVLSERDHLSVRVIGAMDPVFLLLDGQESVPLSAGDAIDIGLGSATVRIFQNPERPFARALQAKLGWQGSEQRSLR